MKKALFILALFGAVSVMADEAWSNIIPLDNESVGTVIQLLPTDEMAYSTRWVPGEGRSAEVTAAAGEEEPLQIFVTTTDGDEGKFVWDYQNGSFDGLSSEETYTLTHTISNDEGVLDTKTALVEILPEPMFAVFGLILLGLLFGRRKAAACFVLTCVLAGSLLAEDIVSDVNISSRWPWEGKVDIDYTIGGKTDVPCNVAFFGRGDKDKEFALTTLTGDGAEGTVPGAGNYRVTWDAKADIPEVSYEAFKVKVQAESTAQADNTVDVVYDGDTATVSIAENITDYVTATIEGADVSLVQSANVSAKTVGEITYNLTGSSSDGSFTMTGSFKATVNITDLDLTSTKGSPFDIENGKRIAIGIEGTNTFVDSASGSQKACFVVKGHPEVSGSGIMTVTGNKKHAIKTGEYMELKKKFKGKIIVLGAKGDGLHIGQYFDMNGGTVKVDPVEDDGIQVEANLEGDEFDGQCFLRGGTVDIKVAAIDVKGIKCDSDMLISNSTVKINCNAVAKAAKGIRVGGNLTVESGNITVATAGQGLLWLGEETNTTACAGIKCVGNVDIKGGTFTLTSTGSGGKGMNIEGDLNVYGGDITVATKGGLYYNNGEIEDTDYQGDPEEVSSDFTSSPKGLKVDGNVTINGGNLNISTVGNNGEGIESKNIMTINGGTITVDARDDGLNASDGIVICGGTFNLVSKVNDGIDSNGDLHIKGGNIVACGGLGKERGLDATEKVLLTGGSVMAIGGCNNTVEEVKSSQALIDIEGKFTHGSKISVKAKDSEETIAEFTVPETYDPSTIEAMAKGIKAVGGLLEGNILISTPDLVVGKTYTVYRGSQVIGEAEAAKEYKNPGDKN